MSIPAADPLLASMLNTYLADRELSPADLEGDVATDAVEWANAQVQGAPYTSENIQAVRAAALQTSADLTQAAGEQSRDLREMGSSQSGKAGHGGAVASTSPAYNILNAETVPKTPAEDKSAEGTPDQLSPIERMVYEMEIGPLTPEAEQAQIRARQNLKDEASAGAESTEAAADQLSPIERMVYEMEIGPLTPEAEQAQIRARKNIKDDE